MNKPKPKMVNPSIDEMLTSIRDAIHEETAREAEEHARTFKPKAAPKRTASLSPPPVARNRSSGGSGVSGSMRELRVSLQPAGQSHTRGTVTARSEDFLALKNKLASLRQSQPPPAPSGEVAGIMGGDVRLEDALSRLNTAEQLQRQNTPAPPHAASRPAEASQPPAELPMRASIDDVPPERPEVAAASVEPAPEAVPQMPEELQPMTEVVEPLQIEQPVPEIVAAPVEVVLAPPEIIEVAAPVEIQPVTERIVPPPVKPAVVVPQREARLPVPPEPQPVMSGDAALAARSAFEHLSEELFSKAAGNSQALADSTRDMIRPMLKKWLDDNLPMLVERLVREEIERVARKGGR